MLRERRVVDDRVFLLGLDELYRTAIKRHEAGELLECVRIVAAELGCPPRQGPVEGYYAESPRLTEYFQLMRALQETDAAARTRVAGLAGFNRLLQVTSSPIYGEAKDTGYLLPSGLDPLSQALEDSAPAFWTVGFLTAQARRVATETDDFSLVGLAAWTGDPLVLTATRESVVLYAMAVLGAALLSREPRYEWAVDPDLATRAAMFVDAFNSLFHEQLPSPKPANAAIFWQAGEDNEVVGRCVRLGLDDSRSPVRHYHWAIGPGSDGRGEVREFWDQEIWTTDRFQKTLGRGPLL